MGMTESEGRRRASETSPEQVRQAVVRAAMPLLADYATLTTAQIADAAGIDEGALLRVFEDKDAVLRACTAFIESSIAAVTEPSRVVRELDCISVQEALAVRLIKVVNALDAYYGR